MTRITYDAFGAPEEVLRLETVPMPELGATQVRLKMLAAVIHPSDLGIITGRYGKLPELPAVAGREGVGEVVAVGDAVTSVAVGDHVRMPEALGTWQTYVDAPAEGLWSLPTSIPPAVAAQAWINPPTAWRLLRDYPPAEGDWVVQNAANSAVGICVFQMAKALGLHCLNVVRRAELEGPLRALGAEVVVTEDSGYEKRVAELTGGGNVTLALNSVGGESAARLIKALSKDGTHVTFGAMTFEPIRFPTRQLIFEGLTLTGFWLDRWYRENSPERIQVMLDKVYDLLAQEAIQPPVAAEFPLAEVQAALRTAQEPKLGKVLLVPGA